jgi:hypothetical protein
VAAQLILTSIRLIGAAAALWLLLPPTPISFDSFAAIFSAATALGAVSHIPGGLGVFEVVVLWTLRGRASSDAIAAALLAYRGIYYVLPLVLSSCAEVKDIASHHLAGVRSKLADLTRLEAVLSKTIGQCTGDVTPVCPVLDILDTERGA